MRTSSRSITIASCAAIAALLGGCTINRTVALDTVPATTVATVPAVVTPAPAVVTTPAPAIVTTPAPAVIVR